MGEAKKRKRLYGDVYGTTACPGAGIKRKQKKVLADLATTTDWVKPDGTTTPAWLTRGFFSKAGYIVPRPYMVESSNRKRASRFLARAGLRWKGFGALLAHLAANPDDVEAKAFLAQLPRPKMPPSSQPLTKLSVAGRFCRLGRLERNLDDERRPALFTWDPASKRASHHLTKQQTTLEALTKRKEAELAALIAKAEAQAALEAAQ